jgi:hypothetical protein
VNKSEKRAAAEQLARNRAVKGWAFRDLPEDEQEAIKAFLNGGPCPEGYRRTYALARKQLKLEDES